MADANLIQFLQRPGLVSAQQAEDVAQHFTPKEIAKHDLFLQEGRVSDEYFFLESGYLRAFAYDPEGNDVTTAFYAPGQVVFECSSFFNRLPSLENIQALTSCVGSFLTFQQLNALFHARPEFREFGRSVLVQGLAGLKHRMLSMITQSATGRYEQLLKEAPQLLLHVPLKNIASYLGVTDTSLSRIRAGVKEVRRP